MHKITGINEDMLTGTCSICGPGVRLKPRYGRQAGQYRCYIAYVANKRKFSSNGDEISKAMIEQKGLCKICLKSKPLVLDHCHTSSTFRGLICRECNLGLGNFEDNIQALENAIRYLSRALVADT